jgi:hypothetical protein
MISVSLVPQRTLMPVSVGGADMSHPPLLSLSFKVSPDIAVSVYGADARRTYIQNKCQPYCGFNSMPSPSHPTHPHPPKPIGRLPAVVGIVEAGAAVCCHKGSSPGGSCLAPADPARRLSSSPILPSVARFLCRDGVEHSRQIVHIQM